MPIAHITSDSKSGCCAVILLRLFFVAVRLRMFVDRRYTENSFKRNRLFYSFCLHKSCGRTSHAYGDIIIANKNIKSCPVYLVRLYIYMKK